MAPPVLPFFFFILSRTEGAWRLPSFSFCFLFSRGREGHGASRPSVFVFYLVEDGRGMAPPVLLFSFFI